MAMPVTQARLELLDAFVVESAKEVCATMLNWTVDCVEHEATLVPKPFELDHLNGCIGFGGQLTGSIFLSCSDELGAAMAKAILGGDYPQGAREIMDVIGELTNMLAGGCKSRLCDSQCNVVMSIPNLIRGKLIRASSKDVKFMLQREFTAPIDGASFKVIALGKFE